MILVYSLSDDVRFSKMAAAKVLHSSHYLPLCNK